MQWHWYELIHESKKQPNSIVFTWRLSVDNNNDLWAHSDEFQTGLRFSINEVFQQRTNSIRSNNECTWKRKYANSVLRVELYNLYFHNHRFAIEVDQFNHSDGDINYEIQRKSAFKNILPVNSLKLILINIILKTISKTGRHIKNHLKGL